ncbi:MAG: Peptidyl-tRNA hydrolase [Pseudomonadota bacterium]|jgi:PTH1 family peptidyl-tRNA hydrolase
MKLFVGLGNPGDKYAGNRHNVGFMAVDAIAARFGFGPWRKKFQGLVSDGQIGSEKVLLLKPQTYMNESGRAVAEAARFHKIEEGDVVVFYDEIDLAPGKLKAKTGGGNAGHNGLKSITAQFANEYQRVRIGVGHPGRKELVAGYVLHDFSKADRDWLDPLLDAIVDACPHLASGDLACFLTEIGQALKDTSGDDGGRKPKSDTSSAPASTGKPEKKANTNHPAGSRMAHRRNALADNLEKWLKKAKRET